MKLDENNKEFNLAVDFIMSTRRNIFLTGKAGTGKTTFLKYIKDNVKRNIVIVAPTGIAAINAGGVTIHSFFQLGFGVYPPNDKRLRTKSSSTDEDKSTIYDHFKYDESKREIFQKMELLIIDEISMVRCDILDTIDKLLRVFSGKNKAYPFGGIQTVLIGDAFQLPPVTKKDEKIILDQHYKTSFFFEAKVFYESNLISIALKKIYRQTELTFIELLNKVRVGNITDLEINQLNKRVNWQGNLFDGEIMLSTHNRSVNEINSKKLREIQKPLYTYIATTTGIFKESDMPTDFELKLKEGAQIIFVKNDVGKERRYFNGKVGKVKTLEELEIEVEFKNSETIWIEKSTWEKIEYVWDDKEKEVKEKLIGTFNQFPIKLAWAITIHKSQGLTFDNIVLDIKDAFESGQAYVGLSRCTSLEGIRLKSRITKSSIKTSSSVIEFNKRMDH